MLKASLLLNRHATYRRSFADRRPPFSTAATGWSHNTGALKYAVLFADVNSYSASVASPYSQCYVIALPERLRKGGYHDVSTPDPYAPRNTADQFGAAGSTAGTGWRSDRHCDNWFMRRCVCVISIHCAFLGA